MKSAAALLLLSAAITAGAVPPGQWLSPVPEAELDWRKWTAIPSSAFFEVPASRLAAAETWLEKEAAVAQETSAFEYFGRADFHCSAPAQPYLVRGIYVNGGTGRFHLSWSGSHLVVGHASLGPGGKAQRSALLACLDRKPSEVYSSVASAT